MKPIIQAAIESGRPPLELLLDKPNRERSKLDGILIKAYYLEKAYELEGYPIWVEESPDITFRAKHRDVRSLAVVEQRQTSEGKKSTPTPGRRIYAEAILRPGAKWPTRAAWAANRTKSDYSDEGMPQERIDEAEQRAAEQVAQDPEAARIVAQFAERFKSAGKME